MTERHGGPWSQFDDVAALVTVLDREGRIVGFNTACERVTGWRAAEVLGRPFWDIFILPEEIEGVRAVFASLRSGMFPLEHENYWRIRSGERRWIAWSNTASLDAKGEVVHVIATGVDISERKRLDDELARSEQRQRFLDEVGDVLAHALPDYDETLRAIARLAVQSFADLCTIAIVDDATGGTRRVATVCSDPAKQHVARGLRELAAGQTQAVIMPRVLQTRRAELHTLESYLADPEKLDPGYVRLIRDLAPSSVIVAPIVARGRALGLLSVARTRSAGYVEDDLRLAVELGERAGLHTDNARQYRLAQQAIRARDDMMSIVAHDLRNPLNSINLQAQVLQRGLAKMPSANESLVKAATDIRGSVARMGQLIADLLDAARAEAGQLVQGTRASDPGKLATEAVESVRALASSKELTLRTTVQPDLPLVSADPERVHQVFANLIGNAIKFTPPGGAIEVTVERGELCVAFTVADTGQGIAPEDLPRIFERYWQGQRSDRRGAGLGLWLCKGIVESHGGVLSAQSAPGQGSRFRFTLPLVARD
jgi:PAS domain S-box-containing protein